MIGKKKKKEITKKFWHDFSNDLYCYSSSEYEKLERYFKGYSNGLLQAGVYDIQEHIRVTNRVTTLINQERAMKQGRNERLKI